MKNYTLFVVLFVLILLGCNKPSDSFMQTEVVALESKSLTIPEKDKEEQIEELNSNWAVLTPAVKAEIKKAKAAI